MSGLGVRQHIGKMDLGMSQLFRLFLLLVSLWCIVGYCTLFLMTPDPESVYLPDPVRVQPSTLSNPHAEIGTYCAQYDPSLLVKRTLWTDRPSAYAV